MSVELIKIEERNGVTAVNARELHQVLGSKQQFTDWIKNRIEKYGFVENQDFEVFHKVMKNTTEEVQVGRPTIDYALSVDMAKEAKLNDNRDLTNIKAA